MPTCQRCGGETRSEKYCRPCWSEKNKEPRAPTRNCRDCSAPLPRRGRIVCDACNLRVKAANGRSAKGRPSGLKGVPKSAETRAAMSAAAFARRESMSERAKGPKSPEFRLARAEDVRNGVSGFRLSKRGAYTCRKGRTFNMRSEWERLTAAYFDRKGWDWDYEPFSIPLPDGSAYVPDFRLTASGLLVEVKGYMSPSCEEKINQARLAGYAVVVYDKARLEKSGVLTSSGLKEYRETSKSSTSRPRRVTSTSGASSSTTAT